MHSMTLVLRNPGPVMRIEFFRRVLTQKQSAYHGKPSRGDLIGIAYPGGHRPPLRQNKLAFHTVNIRGTQRDREAHSSIEQTIVVGKIAQVSTKHIGRNVGFPE